MPELTRVNPATATEPEVRKLLHELSALVRRHQAARLANDAVAFGIEHGKVSASKAREILDRDRDRQAERRAIEELRALYRALNLDTNQGSQALDVVAGGGQQGVGVIPILAVAGVAAGALTLTSLFTYLTEREERIQAQVTGTRPGLLETLFGGPQGNLVKLAGIGLLGYLGYQWWQRRQLGTAPTMLRNPCGGCQHNPASAEPDPEEIAGAWLCHHRLGTPSPTRHELNLPGVEDYLITMLMEDEHPDQPRHEVFQAFYRARG